MKKLLFVLLFALALPVHAACKYPGSGLPGCEDNARSFRLGISFLHASNPETSTQGEYEHNGPALNLYTTIGDNDEFFFSGLVSKGWDRREIPGQWLGQVNAGFYFY